MIVRCCCPRDPVPSFTTGQCTFDRAQSNQRGPPAWIQSIGMRCSANRFGGFSPTPSSTHLAATLTADTRGRPITDKIVELDEPLMLENVMRTAAISIAVHNGPGLVLPRRGAQPTEAVAAHRRHRHPRRHRGEHCHLLLQPLCGQLPARPSRRTEPVRARSSLHPTRRDRPPIPTDVEY